MAELLEQLSQFEIARYRIVLESQTEAVLPAIIGSTLRGAFGHALKAISCSVPHQNCGICFLSDVCLYTSVFEPTSLRLKDAPRPFVFEPPIPPLTREISENLTLKLRVAEQGKISFDLILLGEAIKKMPYFVYAFELMARHGLGADRQPFAISEVFYLDPNFETYSIYVPSDSKISLHQTSNLAELIEIRLAEITVSDRIKIRLLTPLRINRNREILEKITFNEFFKQCSLRLKFLSENYGLPIEYDYKFLMQKAEKAEIISRNLWRHNFQRWANRRERKEPLDGMLGEIEFGADSFADFLPFTTAGEILHIGNTTSFGLGKFEIY